MYGSRKYGPNKVNSPAIPTYVCTRCGKIKPQSSKTVTLNLTVDNSAFLTNRICEECGKLLQDWLKGK